MALYLLINRFWDQTYFGKFHSPPDFVKTLLLIRVCPCYFMISSTYIFLNLSVLILFYSPEFVLFILLQLVVTFFFLWNADGRIFLFFVTIWLETVDILSTIAEPHTVRKYFMFC